MEFLIRIVIASVAKQSRWILWIASLLALLAMAPLFAQTLEPTVATNGGGSQPATPYAAYSGGAVVNVQNGNMSLSAQDISLFHPLGFGLTRSYNAGIGPMTLEKFIEVFEGALPHTAIDTRLDGRNTQVVGKVDKIVYENAEIDLGTLGKLKAVMTKPDTRHHNEVSLRVGSPGWNVAWSDAIGVLVLLNTSPNATQRQAIVLLIHKDGSAEPFDFSTGESLWNKTGSKFTTPFGSTLEEINGLQNLLLKNSDGVQHRFRKVNEGELFYQVYYSFPCDRWSHFSAGASLGVPLFSFTRKTCHADFRVAGWKVMGFKLNRVEDDKGRFVEIDYMDPQPGAPQTITDETGRRITRRIDSNNLEEWQTGDRLWRMQFDQERKLHAATDPEGNTTIYKYDPASAMYCDSCPSPKRNLGWNSLTQPDKFLQIHYPTSGLIRYEWFGEEIPVGEESAGHNTFVIVTEFPNPADRQVFNQKYHWVNEVTQSDRADGDPAIVSTLYDLDGSVKEHFFEKIQGQWRQTEDRLTGNTQNIVKRLTWHLNGDGKTIDGVERVEVTKGGITYTEAETIYDELGRSVAVVDAGGLRTEYEYDGDLAVSIRKVGESGSETVRYVYGGTDVCGRALDERQLNYTFRNINGNEHIINKYCYDANGNVIRELDGESYKLQSPLQIAFNTDAPPPVGTEQIVYDRNTGLLMQEADAYGVVKRYTYNKNGNPIRIDSGGSYIAYVYDVPGRTITTTIHDATAGRNVVTAKKFDGLGNVIEENEGGAVTRYTYTPSKKLQQMIYPDGKVVQYTYDALGRILTQNLSGHQPIRYSYSMRNENGVPVQVTQASVGSEPTVKVEYDMAGNLVAMEKYDRNGDAITTHYTYDTLGNLLNIQTPEGLSISDAVNYSTGEIKRTFPGGDEHQFDLYASMQNGRIEHADASGNQMTADMRYSASTGLLQEIAFPGQSTRLNYGSQGAGKNRLSAIQDNAGETRFAYNSGGAPEKIERTINALGEKYSFYQVKDSFGNLVRLIYPNGLIVYYKYDGQNRVVEVRKDSESGLVLASFEYEGGNDQPARIIYASGVMSEYSYDIAGRLTRIDAKKPDGSFIQQDQFGYDHRGRKISIRHLDGSRIRYEYDGLSRLVAARYFKKSETTPSQFQEYAYDKDGNRIRYRDPLKEIQYTYENGKLTGYQIKQGENSIYQGNLRYALGDLVEQTETRLGQTVFEKRFQFDPQHRLASVDVEDRKNKFKTQSQYNYDYTGRRESVVVDGKTKYFLYGESIDPLMELNAAGEVEAFHVFVNGMRLAKVEGDELDFYHTDEMGNVLKMSSINGEEIQSVRYDPFGAINFMSGSEHNNFLFAGKPYDQATGLYYFGARYYDPMLGRFLSRDPLLQGVNHYVYADNNPVGNVDLYGLWGFHLDLGFQFNGMGFSLPSIRFDAGPLTLSIDAAGNIAGSLDLGKFKLSGGYGIGGGGLPTGSMEIYGVGVGLNPQNFSEGFGKGLGKTVFKTAMNNKLPGTFGDFFAPVQKAGEKLLGLRLFGPEGSGGDMTMISGDDAKHPGHFMSKLRRSPLAMMVGKLNNAVQKAQDWGVLSLGVKIIKGNVSVTDFLKTGLRVAGGSKDPFKGDLIFCFVDCERGRIGFPDSGGGETENGNFEGATDNQNVEEGGLERKSDDPKAGSQKSGGEPTTDSSAKTKADSVNKTDPILLHSGDLLQNETDLKIPGRGMDYEFTRVYRSRITYEGPLGASWDHNYNKRLIEREDGNVARFDGAARFDIYEKQSDASYKSPSGYFDALTKNPNGTFTIRDKHGTVHHYGADGWVVSMADRNGNTIRFIHEGEGESKRLVQVLDTVGRAIGYSYNASGKLERVTDFSGRTIQFGYDAHGDLISVINPAGHAVRYTYSSGYLDDRKELNHNLLTVTDAKGQTYLKNTYSIYDRVTRQTFGDEGTFVIEYNQVASSLECTGALIDKVHYRTRVTDRIGNKIDYTFNCQGNPLEVIRYTRGVRPEDPAKYITQYRYNEAGLLTKMTKPKGNVTEYEYDASGNLIAQRQQGLATTFTYDPNFGQTISVINATGHATNFTLDAKGNITQKCQETICGTYSYNEYGQLISLTDGEGNADSYFYNDNSYLDRIVRGAVEGGPNLTNHFTYDSIGNITAFTDGRGNTFQFEVNTLNQVTREIAPAPTGYERRIEYDENNNIVRISGNATTETRFTYNILDRVTIKTETIDSAHTALTEYRYDLNENITRIIEPEGNSTFIEYDERDLPYRLIQGYRSEIETPKYFSYDDNGNVQTLRDGNGNITQYEYDNFDRIQKIADPLANEMEVGYDEVSNITSITRRGPPDAQLSRTEFIYDALNRLTSTHQHINTSTQSVTQYLYDNAHRLTQLTDANNNVTRFIYDSADRLTQKTDPLGNETRYGYDGNGNVIEVVDAERTTHDAERFANHFVYDSLNRLTERTNNAGHKFTYAYDSRNNLISTTDPKDSAGLDNGSTQGQGNKVRYNYDGLNRLIEEIKELTTTGAGDGSIADTIATRYAYDDNSRLTEITDANNHATRFAYDALNRQIEVRLHNGNTYVKHYDPNGNLIEETQPNGHKVTSIYDALNRLITKNVTLRGSNAGREVFAYDGLSRMTQAQNFDPFDNPIGNVEYEYDSLSRVVAEIQNSRRLGKAYDGVGNITGRIYPSGVVINNTYDAINRLTQIQSQASAEGIIETIFGGPDPVNLLNAQYIGKDRPKHFDLGNGTKTEFAYDNLKRLTEQVSRLPDSNVIAGFAYGYDKASNRLFERQTHNENRANVFQYDSLYRLVSSKNAVPDPLAEVSSPGSQSFGIANRWSLDGVDNWLEKIRDLTPDISDDEQVQRFNPNEVNAYASVNGQSYLYDENGNLLDNGTNIYQYNYRNLLTRVVDKATGEEIAAYGYDALGRRIFKMVDGAMTRYVFEGIHIVAEVSSDNSISTEYIYGDSIDDPIAMLRGSEIYYYHKDGLGSTVALTNATGEVVETYKYGAYGEVEITDASGALLEDSAAGNPFLYTGQFFDSETNFYYYKARYYHPQLGRFLQRDPLGYVDGYNLYAYTANNPINWIDPLGTEQKKAGGSVENRSAGNPQNSYIGLLIGTPLEGPANLSTGNRWIDPTLGVVNDLANSANRVVNDTLQGFGAVVNYVEQKTGVTADSLFWASQKTSIPHDDIASAALVGLSRVGKVPSVAKVANEIPKTLARVIPGKGSFTTLGRTGTKDVFVTAADDIAGMNAVQLQKTLTIQPSKTYTVIEFSTPRSGLASPINRLDPGFVGGGRTAGGAREFVIPNGPVPPGAKVRVVE